MDGCPESSTHTPLLPEGKSRRIPLVQADNTSASSTGYLLLCIKSIVTKQSIDRKSNYFKTKMLFLLCLLVFALPVQSNCPRRMDCYCGITKVPTRIVGGHEISPHKYPWLVSLANSDLEPFCGGALINDRYVLTAAHCLPDTTLAKLRIILGHHDLKKMREATVIRAEKFVPHYMYQETDPVQKWDIALIKLRERVNYTDYINPVCLPGRDTPRKDFKKLIVAGWGRIGENQIVSDRPLEVQVPELTMEQCYKLLHTSRITPNHICAGNRTVDSCEGDSGGPLITFVNDKAVQVGLVSWGVSCAHRIYPGVFTRVSAYAGWINSNTPDGKYCNNQRPYNPRTHPSC